MTFDPAVLPIVDGIAALVTLPAGWTLDAAAVKPYRYEGGHLYAYPVTQRFDPTGTGNADEAPFAVEFVAASAAAREDASLTRDRVVSTELDGAVTAVVTAVRGHRTSEGLWESLRVQAVRYDAIQGFDARCHVIEVAGSRIVEG